MTDPADSMAASFSPRPRCELAGGGGANLVPVLSAEDDRVYIEHVPSCQDPGSLWRSLPQMDWLGERESERPLPRRRGAVVPDLEIVDVEVLGVYDGDTFRVALLQMPQALSLLREWCVRLRGLDCPELHDLRPEMRGLAEDARELLRQLLSVSLVTLHHVGKDKYFRLLADVVADGVDVGQRLVAARLARPWTGRGPKPW